MNDSSSVVTDVALTDLKSDEDESKVCSTSIEPQDQNVSEPIQFTERCDKSKNSINIILLDQSDAQSKTPNSGSPLKSKTNYEEKWTKICSVLENSMEKLSIIDELEDGRADGETEQQ
jgi:hypothetical protein